jgi:hypothetical protein
MPTNVPTRHGDQKWAIIHQLGYFWRLVMIFSKDEEAQNNEDILGDFLLKQIYYIFHLTKQFQNMVCFRYIKVSKVV